MLKRFASLLLLIIVTLAVSASSFRAAQGDPPEILAGTIVLNSADTDINGTGFRAYRIMEVSVGTESIDYSVSAKFRDFFTANSITDDSDAYGYLSDNSEAFVISELKKYIENTEAQPDKTVSGTASNTIEFQNMPYGYYIIISDNNTMLPNLLTLRGERQEIFSKGTVPSVDKKVDGEYFTSAQIGDLVVFTVASSVPFISGDTQDYTFELCDTMSEGLTLDNDSIEVYVGEDRLTEDGYDKTVNINNDGTTSVRITVLDFTGYADKTGEVITFSYSALLNEKAGAGEKQSNRAYITYGDSRSDPCETAVDAAFIYTYELTIFKRAGSESGDPLPGAVFSLYRCDGQGVAQETPVSLVSQSDADGYAAYRVALPPDGSPVTEFESPEDGVIKIRGLDAGKYLLVETQAPEDYGLIDATAVTITAESVDNGVNVTVGGNSVTVINKKKSGMVDAGGTGAGIFIIAGAGLIVAVAVSMIFRKKSVCK